jgi:phage-related protein
MNVEQLVNKIIEDGHNSTPIRPIDSSGDIQKIQENFLELQDKLSFFKNEITHLEKKAMNIFKHFVKNKSQNQNPEFGGLDLFKDVNEDIKNILLHFNNVYLLILGKNLNIFGYVEELKEKQIVEENKTESLIEKRGK